MSERQKKKTILCPECPKKFHTTTARAQHLMHKHNIATKTKEK